MVRLLKRLTLALFALVLVAFIVFTAIDKMKTDTTIPVITIDTEVIELGVKDKQELLLQGVTAYDEKDGDITDKVLIESVSKFIEPGVCTVTYAVADSDKHVVKQTRTLKYTDYTSPEFYMKRALVIINPHAGRMKLLRDLARSGKGIVAAGTDGSHAAIGIHHFAGAAEHQHAVLIGNDHHAFQLAGAVAAPLLRQRDCGALQITGALGKLFFKALAQGESIGYRTGKTQHHLAVVDTAHLLGGGFEYGAFPHGHLTITSNGYLIASAHGANGGTHELHCATSCQLWIHAAISRTAPTSIPASTVYWALPFSSTLKSLASM